LALGLHLSIIRREVVEVDCDIGTADERPLLEHSHACEILDQHFCGPRERRFELAGETLVFIEVAIQDELRQ
jgi:hypothetical protein